MEHCGYRQGIIASRDLRTRRSSRGDGHRVCGRRQKGNGGTGSIIQSDGLVLTNAHVVIEEQTGKPFARLSVFLKPARVTGESKSDLSRMVRAKVVAYSQPLDLALLKLDGVTDALPVVDVSESGRARIGDRVVAIGHPEQGGLWTLTTGVISAEVDNFNGVMGKHVIQTETGLNRGNSGGPLLDEQGRMIGSTRQLLVCEPLVARSSRETCQISHDECLFCLSIDEARQREQ